MSQIIEAWFDGVVLRPTEPLVLEPNTRVRLTIEAAPPPVSASTSFLRTARSLQLDGPADWSANVDAYLYGPEVPEHDNGVP